MQSKEEIVKKVMDIIGNINAEEMTQYKSGDEPVPRGELIRRYHVKQAEQGHSPAEFTNYADKGFADATECKPLIQAFGEIKTPEGTIHIKKRIS